MHLKPSFNDDGFVAQNTKNHKTQKHQQQKKSENQNPSHDKNRLVISDTEKEKPPNAE
jgi:hypothetical protein